MGLRTSVLISTASRGKQKHAAGDEIIVSCVVGHRSLPFSYSRDGRIKSACASGEDKGSALHTRSDRRLGDAIAVLFHCAGVPFLPSGSASFHSGASFVDGCRSPLFSGQVAMSQMTCLCLDHHPMVRAAAERFATNYIAARGRLLP